MMQSGKETSETWTSRLGNILSELTGNNPIIGRVPFDKDRNDDKDKNDAESEASERMLWWRGSVAPARCIGVSEADAESLLRMRRRDLQEEIPDSVRIGLTDILDRLWGRGEIITQKPADFAVREVCKAEFATGESIRFFSALTEAVTNDVVNHDVVNHDVVNHDVSGPDVSNLEMLMDIELPIMLRFGSTHMALRDIASLGEGSIVELDRGVDDPVEVMVNGHVVARGEAVIVDGSYGVRISEISSRRERLLVSPFVPSEVQPEEAGGQG